MKISNIPSFLFAALILTFILYVNGISGPFIYDDYSNLSLLHNSFVQNLTNLPQILTSGISSQLGRPVSLLSFVLQPATFPDSAIIYKLYNLLLHLTNGLLVFLFSRLLYTRLIKESDNNAQQFALLSAVLWLLHPMFVSTTLYVVQRMTQLSFLFSMLALLYFLHCDLGSLTSLRELLKHYLKLSLLIVLAVLSKENAVMIFPILLLLGLKLSNKENVRFRQTLLVFCILPLILLIWKLAPYASDARFASAGYAYGPVERVMTQAVVLVSYLQSLIFPDVLNMSLHHDDIKTITSWSDIQFLVSIFIISTLLAVTKISKNPIIRFSILWFFIWHLLESTFLPLILYFEHRNYLPGLGIIWLFSFLALQLRAKFSNDLVQKIMIVVPVFILSFSTGILTYAWSDETKLVDFWSNAHPKSERTALARFNKNVKAGNLNLANEQLNTLPESRIKSSLPIALTQLSLDCSLGKSETVAINLAIQLSQSTEHIGRSIQDVHSSISSTLIRNKEKCPTTLEKIQTISESILQNAPQKKRHTFKAQIRANQAFIALNVGKFEKALDYFEKSYSNGRGDLLIPLIDINIQLNNIEQANVWVKEAHRYEQNRGKNEPSITANLNILLSRYNNLLNQ